MLKYVTGDVTEPQGDGVKVIPHVVNDQGVMGAGVAKALYTKWPQVKWDYHRNAGRGGLLLGDVINTIAVSGEIYVQSMVAQSVPGKVKHERVERITTTGVTFPYAVQRQPLRYGALTIAMRHVGAVTSQVGASIHAPRFGSDLAGGDWSVIEQLILEIWVDNGLPVTIYDL